MKYVMIFLLSFLVITGCKQEVSNEQEEVNDAKGDQSVEVDRSIDRDSDSLEANFDGTIDEAKAIQDAELFLKIVKEKNSLKLLELLNRSHFYSHLGIEDANKIIEGFELNFRLESLIIETYYDGYAMHPEISQYEFLLSSNDQNQNEMKYDQEHSLIVRYEENGSATFYNPYVNYFPQAEEMVSKYLELIKSDDSEKLALFMNPDDIEVPIWVAEDTISKYKKYFDSMDMSVRYLNNFTFVIENGGNQHQIEVIYGDGLMSIKDEFIPDF